MSTHSLFRNKTLYNILEFLFSQPERDFFVRELSRATKTDVGNVQRELARLEKDGFVISEVKGKNKYVRLNTQNPILDSLAQLFAAETKQKLRYVVVGEEDNMNFLTTL